jgi:hypothetical protein
MPRNSSGTYTLPNSAVVTGTPISSSDENTTRNDIASELTNSLDRTGRGGMTGAFRAADGSSGVPGIAFTSDTNTGMWRNGADDWSMGCGGTEVARLTATSFLLNAPAMVPLSPSQITSNQNDYAPTGIAAASLLRLSTDASRDITGLTTGVSGRLVCIHNVGSNNIVLKDESASSTAANRFALQSDITLSADGVVIFQYDATTSRWRANGLQASAFIQTLLDDVDAATARATLAAAGSGAATASGLTMSTSRLLGRTTASTGAIEEISVGARLTLSSGSLSSSGGVTARSSNTILAAADNGKTFAATSTFTQTLTAAATLADGWYCDYRNNGTGIITFDPNASETINGATTLAIYPGEACRIICDGSNFQALFLSRGLVLIGSSTASGAASVAFTAGIDSSFDEYQIHFHDVTFSNAAGSTGVWLRVSEDGGSTWKSGGTDYTYSYFYIGAAGGSAVGANSTGDSKIIMTADAGNSSNKPGSGLAVFGLPSGTTNRKMVFTDTCAIASDGNSYRTTGNGSYKGTTNAINGFQVLPSTGNLTGTFYLYGLRKG